MQESADVRLDCVIDELLYGCGGQGTIVNGASAGVSASANPRQADKGSSVLWPDDLFSQQCERIFVGDFNAIAGMAKAIRGTRNRAAKHEAAAAKVFEQPRRAWWFGMFVRAG
jgi:hypothetical protein